MSYMKLKQFALVISLVVFGTQCAALTREEAQNQPLNEDQQKAVITYVGQLFNDTTNTDINWYCFAGAIAQFINEHKKIAQNAEIDKRLKDLAGVLNSTSDVSPYIPYIEALVGIKLQNYKDLFANNPAAQQVQKSDSEILELLKNRINYQSQETCKDDLVNTLYCIAHPGLCKRSMAQDQSAQTTPTTKEQPTLSELEKKAKELEALLASEDLL
jgi:hypothetical protein